MGKVDTFFYPALYAIHMCMLNEIRGENNERRSFSCKIRFTTIQEKKKKQSRIKSDK